MSCEISLLQYSTHVTDGSVQCANALEALKQLKLAAVALMKTPTIDRVLHEAIHLLPNFKGTDFQQAQQSAINYLNLRFQQSFPAV